MKVLLIAVDGMRPDRLCEIPFAEKLMRDGSFSLNAKTVIPSVTFPCFMSMFHSVDPTRHNNVTNTYAPQVRPINGLCEQLKAAGKTSALFYNWEELRDLWRPGNVDYALYSSTGGYEESNRHLTDECIKYIKKHAPDFAFLYLGWTDLAGHREGWMSDEYMRSVRGSWEEIEDVMKSLPEEYAVIITADHGGHDRTHGTELPEDMTIPMFLYGAPFESGKELDGADIKDIAPTVARLLSFDCASEWEGASLI